MTPPVAPSSGTTPDQGTPQAAFSRLEVLRKRADFLAAARAKRVGKPGFLLQARPRSDVTTAIRVGFTCSKKLGNAIMRNRAKRRLREIARHVLPTSGRPGWDYVLVGRPKTSIEHDFSQMLTDLEHALSKVHQ